MKVDQAYLRGWALTTGFDRWLLEARTDGCHRHVPQGGVRLGAEMLILGDDAGHQRGSMVSPRLWRELVLPLHRRVVDEAGAPVVWHSDGNVEALLPMAVEAGFAGVHGLEPAAGMDLADVQREFGRHLVLVGNVDVGVLCAADLKAVRCEVSRCLEMGAAGGGHMLATCNSIFAGMNPTAVAEMFRHEREWASVPRAASQKGCVQTLAGPARGWDRTARRTAMGANRYVVGRDRSRAWC